jgi:hypothetical protein
MGFQLVGHYSSAPAAINDTAQHFAQYSGSGNFRVIVRRAGTRIGSGKGGRYTADLVVESVVGSIVTVLLAIVLIEILVRLLVRYLPRKPKN